MRKFILIAVVAAAAVGYWQKDKLLSLVGQKPVAQTIYQWTDARGKVHFGNEAEAGAHAKAVELKPLTVTPEFKLSKEMEASIQARAEDEKRRAALARQAPGGAEEATAGLKTKPELPQVRNLALERMQQAKESAGQ